MQSKVKQKYKIFSKIAAFPSNINPQRHRQNSNKNRAAGNRKLVHKKYMRRSLHVCM